MRVSRILSLGGCRHLAGVVLPFTLHGWERQDWMGFAKPTAATGSGFTERRAFNCCLTQCQKAGVYPEKHVAGCWYQIQHSGLLLVNP